MQNSEKYRITSNTGKKAVPSEDLWFCDRHHNNDNYQIKVKKQNKAYHSSQPVLKVKMSYVNA